ncbi:hypothetical protein GYMLUDRAFT_250911 [Collybiopsis luxurians FD-317 M1]|uniref:Uncharacterized protein n=1 Tax=Collybiopsis luxurians FD-317 M1 TaxID=944289 RepID=A0A0D0BDW1_9AGAR|nr:hypothetical protein GYMLUDRAFT_250911 [Collybiopsis luxurians FD-317 M1]
MAKSDKTASASAAAHFSPASLKVPSSLTKKEKKAKCIKSKTSSTVLLLKGLSLTSVTGMVVAGTPNSSTLEGSAACSSKTVSASHVSALAEAQEQQLSYMSFLWYHQCRLSELLMAVPSVPLDTQAYLWNHLEPLQCLFGYMQWRAQGTDAPGIRPLPKDGMTVFSQSMVELINLQTIFLDKAIPSFVATCWLQFQHAARICLDANALKAMTAAWFIDLNLLYQATEYDHKTLPSIHTPLEIPSFLKGVVPENHIYDYTDSFCCFPNLPVPAEFSIKSPLLSPSPPKAPTPPSPPPKADSHKKVLAEEKKGKMKESIIKAPSKPKDKKGGVLKKAARVLADKHESVVPGIGSLNDHAGKKFHMSMDHVHQGFAPPVQLLSIQCFCCNADNTACKGSHPGGSKKCNCCQMSCQTCLFTATPNLLTKISDAASVLSSQSESSITMAIAHVISSTHQLYQQAVTIHQQMLDYNNALQIHKWTLDQVRTTCSDLAKIYKYLKDSNPNNFSGSDKEITEIAELFGWTSIFEFDKSSKSASQKVTFTPSNPASHPLEYMTPEKLKFSNGTFVTDPSALIDDEASEDDGEEDDEMEVTEGFIVNKEESVKEDSRSDSGDEAPKPATPQPQDDSNNEDDNNIPDTKAPVADPDVEMDDSSDEDDEDQVNIPPPQVPTPQLKSSIHRKRKNFTSPAFIKESDVKGHETPTQASVKKFKSSACAPSSGFKVPSQNIDKHDAKVLAQISKLAAAAASLQRQAINLEATWQDYTEDIC